MITYHGVIIVPLALIGAVIGLRRRDSAALLAVGWLILALDFSTTGIIPSLLGGLLAPLLRYDYPFSIAWHAPIIPYTILGGISCSGCGIVWQNAVSARRCTGLPGGLNSHLAVIAVVGLLNRPLVEISKDQINFFSTSRSQPPVSLHELAQGEHARRCAHPQSPRAARSRLGRGDQRARSGLLPPAAVLPEYGGDACRAGKSTRLLG